MTKKTYTSGDDGSLGYGVGGQSKLGKTLSSRTDDGVSEVAGSVTAKGRRPRPDDNWVVFAREPMTKRPVPGSHRFVGTEREARFIAEEMAQSYMGDLIDIKPIRKGVTSSDPDARKQLGPRASDEYREGEIIKVPGVAMDGGTKALNSVQQSVARAAWLGDYDQTMRLLPQLSYADTQGLLRYANEQLQGGRDLTYKERAGLRRIGLWITEFARSKKKSVKASSSEQVRKYLNDQGFDVGAREFEVHGEGDYVLSVIRTGGGPELAKRDMERARVAISRYPGARIHSAEVMQSSHRPDGGWSVVIGFTVRGAKKKSNHQKAADLDASVHLLTLSQAADTHSLAAVNRALADLRGTVLTDEDKQALADFRKRAVAAQTPADWNKLKREAGRMLTAYMVRGSVKSIKLLPGMKVKVKSQNAYAVIKECSGGGEYFKVAFIDADDQEIRGSMAVCPKSDLQVRSKKAYKRVKARTKEIRRSAWNVALPKNKIEQVVSNPDVLIDESLVKELLGLVQMALTYEELEKPHLRALQKMQSALGSAGQMAKQMKKDLKQRDERSPEGKQARLRLEKTQNNIRNVLKGAVTTANEALQATMGERVRGRPGAEDFDRQRQQRRPGLLRRAFGRRSVKHHGALRTARRKVRHLSQ